MTDSELYDIARALRGNVVTVTGRKQVIAPGPGHSAKDRSLSVRMDSKGNVRVYSFSPRDSRTACENYVARELRRPIRRSEQTGNNSCKTDTERTARALVWWDEARHPQGTVVDRYLRGRGVAGIAVDAYGHALRFHPQCPFGKRRVPCMLALVRDAVTDEPKAVHRTALSLDGRKVEIDGFDRLSYGPTRGGAIKLTHDKFVTLCLGIGEGIETTLSMRLVPEFGASSVWSLIWAGGIEQFPVLPGIESLWIAVDNDESQTGQKASLACARKWRDAGREVFLITPSAPRTDLNDLATGARHA